MQSSLRRRVAAVTLIVALAAACSPAPPLDEEPIGEPTPPAEEDEPDLEVIALADELERARDEVTTVLETLTEAAEQADPQAAGQAVALLSASPELRGAADAPDGPEGVLPADEPGGDVLSRLLGHVRDSGRAGTRVNAVLNDPVIGDTTAWQRQPDERNDEITRAAQEGSEEAIDTLEGQLPRALAWSIVAAGSQGEALREAAERAAAHTAVALTALDQVLTEMRAELDSAFDTGGQPSVPA